MTRKLLCLPAALLLGGLLLAAPAPTTTTGTITDRANYIPHRKYQPLPGKVVGLLLGDVVAKMAHEGRSGAADYMGFSAAGHSYNWVYVPVQADAQITNFRVKTGAKGDGMRVYPLLSMAKPGTVAQWGLRATNALVELEVNNGDGAPPDEGFVATNMTRLDGTKEYPLIVTDALADVKARYTKWKAEQKDKLDDAMTQSQKQALKNGKATGPRESNELMYATWLPETKRLRVHFRTELTDGEYKFSGGGIERDPPDPRVPPRLKDGLAAFPPPPPREFPRVRWGTQFGIEFGMAYEVSAEGKVVRELTLPAQAFKRDLPPPLGGPRRPFDLPPRR